MEPALYPLIGFSVPLLGPFQDQMDQPPFGGLSLGQKDGWHVCIPLEPHRFGTPLCHCYYILQGLWIILEESLHLLRRLEVELIGGPVPWTRQSPQVGSGHKDLVEAVVFGLDVSDLV